MTPAAASGDIPERWGTTACCCPSQLGRYRSRRAAVVVAGRALVFGSLPTYATATNYRAA